MSVIFPQSDVLMPFSVVIIVGVYAIIIDPCVVPYCRRMSRWAEVGGVGGGVSE